MEQLPLYTKIIFILTTLLAFLMLYKASSYSKAIIVIMLLWLAVQSVISLTGFYTVTDVMPPRFTLLVLPPILLIAGVFFTNKGKTFIDTLDIKVLTLIHVVRIPVELTLYFLYLHKVIPEIMTFEGRNFDILSGLSAPVIYYFGYIKNVFGKKIMIAWNIVCLLLLLNIVTTAVLSAPFPFQQFGFDQPNIAILYFPFIWVPCFIVPIVLFSHLVVIRRLIKSGN